MSNQMIIALAQMELATGQKERNLQKAAAWTAAAARQGADLILFPELWASGYDLKNSRELSQPRGEGAFAVMRELCESHQMMLGGSLLEFDAGEVYNTLALYQPGQPPGYYRKVHLFRLLNEQAWLAPGNQMVTVETRFGLIGLSICYDLRFPELFRIYADAGVCLVLLSAVWPRRRIIHWQKLLQARGIENQVFLAAVNRVGSLEEEILGGSSTVINPLGEPLLEMNEEEGLLVATVDLEEVQKTRRWMPVLEDRRRDLY